MIPGLRGSLLSHDALRSAGLTTHAPPTSMPVPALETLRALHEVVMTQGGPAWSARTVLDRIALPFCSALGLELSSVGGAGTACVAVAARDGRPTAIVIATPWGQEPSSGWRESVRAGIAAGLRWCYCFSGQELRIFDAVRTHSRRHAEIHIAALAVHDDTRAAVWNLLGDRSRAEEALDAAVALSERHRSEVRASLQAGVHAALARLTTAFEQAGRRRRGARDRTDILDESLVVVYRVLFLLFAEARALVPVWHPTYRDSYTIEALRAPVERSPRPPGLWETLQSMSRLAHRGCRAGTLHVPPFNGRLFSPEHAPLADSATLDDGAVRDAVLALTTRATPHGRERLAYADLGVEQLGGVYERVLDYDVRASSSGVPQLVPGGRRKATGTFYTPRAMTEYLVRRTLAPLTADATPAEILRLKVLDPAMGSGAFLVAACRHLARAYEEALVRTGAISPGDISDGDRAAYRRLVAQRVLFGVDLNPMAVQLARLSLWLATLSRDRPLTFFDHHLRAGNSLVGANLLDVARGAAGRRHRRATPLPLLDLLPAERSVGATVSLRRQVLEGAEDTLAQVRAKEALLASLMAPDAPLSSWKALADLWCAEWFDPGVPPVNRATFGALVDSILGRPGRLPEAAASTLLTRGAPVAQRERFFHWELEFPEVFHAPDGSPLPDAGFDAIIGNPPWEMLRADGPSDDKHGGIARLTRFARDSGIYRLQGNGHANLYQIFLERCLALTRKGGRIGLILPSGLASDHGSAALRRHLLDATTIDSFTIVENREGLFPIHRGLKFVLTTCTRTPPRGDARTMPLRTGITAAAEFDRLPDTGNDPVAVPVQRALIEQISGEQLAIPELRSPLDVALVGRLLSVAPAAEDPAGWGLEFGRELNATDDREAFNTEGRGLPIVEGKQVSPFRADLASSIKHIALEEIERLRPGRDDHRRARLAYRDVASSTNRLTLIAAVLPAGAVTTHTLYCLKTPVDEETQHYLCGIFNSFVANYYVRLRVTTHVNVSIVARLPVPRPDRASPAFRTIARLARNLSATPGDVHKMVQLQVQVARLFTLRREEFSHLLDTFPLVAPDLRDACLTAFDGTI